MDGFGARVSSEGDPAAVMRERAEAQRLPTMLQRLAALPLAPVLLVQGLLVRRRTPRLPEPPGPRGGVAGRGPPLRLLITGDSAAAGVGASHQEEALLGQVTRRLAATRRVEYRLLATTGATTASTLECLRNADADRFDVVVTSLGVNDVTSARRLSRWREDQSELRERLRRSYGASVVIVSGVPPMGAFPALPQPLRWYLGTRARRFDRALRRDVAGEAGCTFLSLDFARDPGYMAEDGFHPGPAAYELWARRIAEVAAGPSR